MLPDEEEGSAAPAESRLPVEAGEALSLPTLKEWRRKRLVLRCGPGLADAALTLKDDDEEEAGVSETEKSVAEMDVKGK